MMRRILLYVREKKIEIYKILELKNLFLSFNNNLIAYSFFPDSFICQIKIGKARTYNGDKMKWDVWRLENEREIHFDRLWHWDKSDE